MIPIPAGYREFGTVTEISFHSGGGWSAETTKAKTKAEVKDKSSNFRFPNSRFPNSQFPPLVGIPDRRRELGFPARRRELARSGGGVRERRAAPPQRFYKAKAKAKAKATTKAKNSIKDKNIKYPLLGKPRVLHALYPAIPNSRRLSGIRDRHGDFVPF